MRTAVRIGLASALVAVSVGAPWMLRHHARLELRARGEVLGQQTSRLSLLVEENGRLSNLLAQAAVSPPLTKEQLHELMRLRNEMRWLGEQTNLAARLQTENRQLQARLAGDTPDQGQLAPAEFQTAFAAELTEAMKRILPALQPAMQKYALAHSNQCPDRLSELQDYLPMVAGHKMVGLDTMQLAREEGPRLSDALMLRGRVGRRPEDGSEVRIYGFSDGRVVEVASEDGKFDNWEAQHMSSPPADTEGNIYLESEGTVRDRAEITEIGASVGISTEDANRFFDRLKECEKVVGPKLDELEKSLIGSPEERQRQQRAAIEEELNRIAIETLGDQGPPLVQKILAQKLGEAK